MDTTFETTNQEKVDDTFVELTDYYKKQIQQEKVQKAKGKSELPIRNLRSRKESELLSSQEKDEPSSLPPRQEETISPQFAFADPTPSKQQMKKSDRIANNPPHFSFSKPSSLSQTLSEELPPDKPPFVSNKDTTHSETQEREILERSAGTQLEEVEQTAREIVEHSPPANANLPITPQHIPSMTLDELGNLLNINLHPDPATLTAARHEQRSAPPVGNQSNQQLLETPIRDMGNRHPKLAALKQHYTQSTISQTPGITTGATRPLAQSTPMNAPGIPIDHTTRLDPIEETGNYTQNTHINQPSYAPRLSTSLLPGLIPLGLMDSDSSESEIPIQDNRECISEYIRYPKVKSTRDSLLSRKGNYAVFTSSDCKFASKNVRAMIELNYFEPDQIKKFVNKIPSGILINRKDNLFIFLIFVKEKYFQDGEVSDLQEGLKALKKLILENKIPCVRISCKGDMFDNIPELWFRKLIGRIFKEDTAAITLCYGEITTPPLEERPGIIQEYHSSIVGGHKGVNRTYKRIRERFAWPNLKDQVQEAIRKCESCQREKLVRLTTRSPMIITDTAHEAFEKISLDTVGPLPRTRNGNKHILTILDNLTKYCLAIPIPDLKASTIADAFAQNFIAYFGAPKAILTDRGTSFMSELLKELASIFRIKKYATSGYRPQSNGSLERSHQSLIDYIKHFTDVYDNWDELLPYATMSFNTSVNASTNFSPFHLVFGKPPRMPSEFSPVNERETYGQYAVDLRTRLDEIQEIAREHLTQAKQKSKERYDSSQRPVKFSIGDEVFVLREPKTNKLDSNYVGPYQIIKILDHNTAVVKNERGKEILKHMDKLKHAYISSTSDEE